MINIKDKGKEKVLKYADQAISLYEEDFTLKGANIQKYFKYIYAISHHLTGIDSPRDAKEIIGKSLKAFRSSPSKTIGDFKNILIKAEKDTICRNVEKYYFVIPVNIKCDSLCRRQVSILGKQIKLRNYKYILNNFSINELANKSRYDERINNGINRDLTYWVFEEYSSDEHKAMRQALREFDLLRAIINFSHDSMSIHYSFGGPTEPLSLVCPKKTFFEFDSNKSYRNFWIVTENYADKLIDFKTNSSDYCTLVKRMNIIIRRLNSIKDPELRYLIVNALYFYGNALDYYDRLWLSFLSYWQIFELLSLGKNQLKQDEICKRVVALLGHNEPYEDLLDYFKIKRNNIVHHGKFEDISEDDTNIIKGIAEHAILFILFEASHLKNISGLNVYYEHINSNEKDIKLKKSILGLIDKTKSKHSKNS